MEIPFRAAGLQHSYHARLRCDVDRVLLSSWSFASAVFIDAREFKAMSQNAAWEFAREIITRRFKGVKHPIFLVVGQFEIVR